MHKPIYRSFFCLLFFSKKSRLFKFKGAGVKLIIYALFGYELFMVSAFDYPAMIKHHDNIGVAYR